MASCGGKYRTWSSSQKFFRLYLLIIVIPRHLGEQWSGYMHVPNAFLNTPWELAGLQKAIHITDAALHRVRNNVPYILLNIHHNCTVLIPWTLSMVQVLHQRCNTYKTGSASILMRRGT
jgi:hypothetical protein